MATMNAQRTHKVEVVEEVKEIPPPNDATNVAPRVKDDSL